MYLFRARLAEKCFGNLRPQATGMMQGQDNWHKTLGFAD